MGIDRDSIDDLKQFLRLELLKSSKNKWRYDNWSTIVYSVINRRCKDFVARDRRSHSRLKYEAELELHNEDGSTTSYLDTVTYENERGPNLYLDVFEKIKVFYTRVKSGDLKHRLTPWQLECLDVLIFLCENKCSMEKTEIMECMGEDVSNQAVKNSFSSKYANFCKKMRTFAEEIGLDEDWLC